MQSLSPSVADSLKREKDGHMLGRALKLATLAHDEILDQGKKPYILHPLAVMHKLRTADVEIQCIALLHDVIEDTDTTYEDLKNAGMTDRIIEGVAHLTKIPGETYEQYKNKVKSNRDAVLVKMADLMHNSDLRRLKSVEQKHVDRSARYMKFFYELEMEKRSWTS